MKPPVQERLRKFIEYLRISIKAFERSINVENSYVNSIRNSIPPEKLDSISKEYPELDMTWLIMGTGQMLKQDNSLSQLYTEQDSSSTNYSKLLKNMEIAEKLISFQEKEIERLNKEIERLKAKEVGALGVRDVRTG